MQKTIIAAAVAGLLAVPAFAQTRVILSGKINASYEWVQAKGARDSNQNMKMKDRMTESGSELHIKAYEDLGNGNQAFVDLQTAIDIFGGNNKNTPGAGRIGSRRGVVGLKGKWGSLELGKWDIHYNAQIWGGTGPNAALNQMYGAVSLLNQVGGYSTMGCRCDNTVRYVTPNIGGFQATFAYTRGQGVLSGSDASTSEIAWDSNDKNKNHRGFGIAAKYNYGGLKLMAAYWILKDSGATNAANVTLTDQMSWRLGAAYTFNFGLTIGLTYDYSEFEQAAAEGGNTGASRIHKKTKNKRNAFAIPVYYKTGPHQINFAYGWADDIKGDGAYAGDDSGAQYWTINYGYALSKRTTLYAGFVQYKNDTNAKYDFWSNTGLNGAVGSDPTAVSIGIIHSF